jgi:hypothetical protein
MDTTSNSRFICTFIGSYLLRGLEIPSPFRLTAVRVQGERCGERVSSPLLDRLAESEGRPTSRR